MNDKLIKLTKDLISLDSVSKNTNKLVVDYIQKIFAEYKLQQELIKYIDSNGVEKYNLIAKKGVGTGGLAFLIHSDTVPYANIEQLSPVVKDGKIIGRGACDMKGPAMASILAGLEVDLDYPITYIITSDEEIGCFGAEFIVNESKLLKETKPIYAIATEPTELVPVYAHKGLCYITVTAEGKAAHSSTTEGDSANFKMIPFLYYVSQLREKYEINETYHNMEFSPKTNTLNLTFTDFNCSPNVTAAKSQCNICFRAMPNSKTEEIITEIKEKAFELNLDFKYMLLDSIHTDPNSKFVKMVSEVCNKEPETVAYLTDATHFSSVLNPIILGPGSIKNAHTKDEFISINELEMGYEFYKEILIRFSAIK